MQLEKQVCSLESAKKLKELGVVQESLFYWADISNVDGNEKHKWVILNGNCDKLESCSSYTIAELGVMLQQEFQFIRKISNEWVFHVEMISINKTYPALIIHEKTEAESRAKILIYLLENNLTTVDEVNRRVKE